MSGAPTPRTEWNIQASLLRLRNNGGAAFDEFVKQFDHYMIDVITAMTAAPPSEILISQGRAQQMQKISQMLHDSYVDKT